LHVYIGGDGKPFVTPTRVARDPSPLHPFVFRLQDRDDGDNIYVGRPCYHGLANEPPCTPLLWTNQRYSSAVVSSMVAAVQTVSAGREIVLIGYSGGGTIAMLMAPHLPNLLGVITIAANLDIAAWTNYHGYTALNGSLNPVELAVATRGIPQRHYFGSNDEVVPASVVEHVRDAMPRGSVTLLDGFDHSCCWARVWPQLLHEAQVDFAAVTTPARNEFPRSRHSG